MLQVKARDYCNVLSRDGLLGSALVVPPLKGHQSLEWFALSMLVSQVTTVEALFDLLFLNEPERLFS